MQCSSDISEIKYGTQMHISHHPRPRAAVHPYCLISVFCPVDVPAKVDGHVLWQSKGRPTSGDNYLLNCHLSGRLRNRNRLACIKHVEFLASNQGQLQRPSLEQKRFIVCILVKAYVNPVETPASVRRLRSCIFDLISLRSKRLEPETNSETFEYFPTVSLGFWAKADQ